MDALSLNLPRPTPLAGCPPDPSSPVAAVRRPLAALIRAVAGLGSNGAGGAEGARRRLLLAYTGGSIVLGLGLLAWTTAVVPVGTLIDPGLAGTALDGTEGGLLLWVMFGLLGSLRLLRAPGTGSVMTFHLPFIGAAMVLGGPTAGAWVALLSTIERREIESQPWYGTLANHAVMTTAAVAGGAAARLIAALAMGLFGPGPSAFVAAIGGTLVLTVVSTSMAALTVMIRDELSPAAMLEILSGQVGRLTALEVALAWVLTIAFIEVGWWSPLVIGGFVLLVWDNDPMPVPDALTGLLVASGFRRRMEAGLGRMRRGTSPGATLLSVDLDAFKAANDRHGHDVGDEILRTIGERLRAHGRRPGDLAGRLGGDELALFLPGLTDVEVACRRAEELWATIAMPVPTSAGPLAVGASIGVYVIHAWGGVPSVETVLRRADQAMYLAKHEGGGTHLYDPAEPPPFEEDREPRR